MLAKKINNEPKQRQYARYGSLHNILDVDFKIYCSKSAKMV